MAVPKPSKMYWKLAVEVLKGNGFVNFILNPNENSEVGWTIDEHSFGLFVTKLTRLIKEERGTEFMLLDLYENNLPPDDVPDEGVQA